MPLTCSKASVDMALLDYAGDAADQGHSHVSFPAGEVKFIGGFFLPFPPPFHRPFIFRSYSVTIER